MSAINYSELSLQQKIKTTQSQPLCQRTLLLSIAWRCLIYLLFFDYTSYKNVLALAQTTTNRSPTIKNEYYTSTSSVSSVGQLLTIPTGLTTLQPTTTTLTSNQSSLNQQQPKTLKFTLVAGKYWKFQIKSFTSHKEVELRLHRIIPVNNYIIDDDFWFQYNPQQQLLFAWPNLFDKPKTYQFALIPSGIDFESDSEDSINLANLVVTNIVVELIRPIYPSNSNDIDQYIDYKFSLEYLHRHSTYPLLLNQITAVFEALSSTNNNIKQSTNNQQLNLNLSITTTVAPASKSSLILYKLKGLKPTNKLAEILLVNQTYTQDGQFFSLQWTTQPSLINNTITQIQDCRLGTINDTITKLSNISSGYPSGDDKFTLHYPLEATAALNTQAIVSTDRGQHLLKLNLLGSCKRSKILDDLGIVAINSNSERSLNATPPANVIAFDIEDKDISTNTINNNSVDSTILTNKNNSQASHPNLPEPEAIDSSTAAITTIIKSITPTPSSSVPSTTLPTSSIKPASETEDTAVNELMVEKVNKTTLEALQVDESRNSNSNNTSDISISTPVVLLIDNVLENRNTKNQPQAKSFADFLDTNDQQPSTTALLSQQTPTATVNSKVTEFEEPTVLISTTTATAPMQKTSPNTTTMLDSNLSTLNNNDSSTSSSVAITPATSESSLNEDFLGLLNNVMDYLVSVAVPASIIVGSILIFSILIALCHLCIKRKKSKEFQVRNRFKFRYGSERRGFLKNSSKPVILDADRKSLSCGGTPMHQQQVKNAPNFDTKTNNKDPVTYLQMRPISSGDPIQTYSINEQH